MILQRLCLVTHAGDADRPFFLVDRHGKVSVYIGRDALRCSFYLYNGKGDTQSVLVFHRSMNRVLPLCCVLHLEHINHLSIHIICKGCMRQQAFHGSQLVHILERDGQEQRVVLHIIGITDLVISLC